MSLQPSEEPDVIMGRGEEWLYGSGGPTSTTNTPKPSRVAGSSNSSSTPSEQLPAGRTVGTSSSVSAPSEQQPAETQQQQTDVVGESSSSSSASSSIQRVQYRDGNNNLVQEIHYHHHYYHPYHPSHPGNGNGNGNGTDGGEV
ncbi:hypothetical protein FQN52_005393 [Onygenales sp. PD_12]|nr:hypothetical protein FQN52_005393 [Onygenales sp. PD_12]